MRGLFQRKKADDEGHIDRREVEALLPASVRHPEANRFTPLGSDFDGDETSDEDIEFLTSLVESLDREQIAPALPVVRPTPPPARRPAIPAVVPPSDTDVFTQPDHLQLFRDMQPDDKDRRTTNIKVDDVDLGDLLEDLSTTMAALRRLKAA
jgi:hypothetical protein